MRWGAQGSQKRRGTDWLTVSCQSRHQGTVIAANVTQARRGKQRRRSYATTLKPIPAVYGPVARLSIMIEPRPTSVFDPKGLRPRSSQGGDKRGTGSRKCEHARLSASVLIHRTHIQSRSLDTRAMARCRAGHARSRDSRAYNVRQARRETEKRNTKMEEIK